jgi:DNA-directed RNA polymerase subunit L
MSSVPVFRPNQQGIMTSGVIHYTNEDHTLGNVLRHELLDHPDVQLSGYRITHPLKNEMTVTVVPKGTKSVPEVVNETLDQLVLTCDDLLRQCNVIV